MRKQFVFFKPKLIKLPKYYCGSRSVNWNVTDFAQLCAVTRVNKELIFIADTGTCKIGIN